MHLNTPFRLSGGEVAQAASEDAYIEQLIEAVLFTVPGERVNRPDFGCGIQHVVFLPDNTALIEASLFIVRGQLERQLAGIIRVEHATAEAAGGELHIVVQYADASGTRPRTARFRHRAPHQ